MFLLKFVGLLFGFCLGLASSLTAQTVSQDEVLDVVMKLKLELEEVSRRVHVLEEKNQSLKTENEDLTKRVKRLEVQTDVLVENVEFMTENAQKGITDVRNDTVSQIKRKRLLLSDVVVRLKLELEQVTRRMNFLETENEGMKKRIEKLEVTKEALTETVEAITTDSARGTQKWKSGNYQATSNATLSQRKGKRLLVPTELESPVAFTAVLTHDVTLGPLRTIEYDKLITNIGNGYDPRHGHFTAPIKGIYLFSATISSINQVVRVEMVINGKQAAAMQGLDYDIGSHTIVVVLEQNDSVWIRHFDEASATVHAGSDRYYSSFSGVLITRSL